jgi:hypothetical protein
MPDFDHMAFGAAVTRIKRDADKLARDAHMARVYAKDTAQSIGQADYDLLYAAQCLELAARDLRLTHAKVQQLRADLNNPHLIAAE